MPLAAKMIGRVHYLLILGEIDKATYFNVSDYIKFFHTW